MKATFVTLALLASMVTAAPQYNDQKPQECSDAAGGAPTPSPSQPAASQCIAADQKCTDSQSNVIGTCCEGLVCAGSICNKVTPITDTGDNPSSPDQSGGNGGSPPGGNGGSDNSGSPGGNGGSPPGGNGGSDNGGSPPGGNGGSPPGGNGGSPPGGNGGSPPGGYGGSDNGGSPPGGNGGSDNGGSPSGGNGGSDNGGSPSGGTPPPSPSPSPAAQCIAVNQKCTDSQSNFLGKCCDKLICAGSVCTEANPIPVGDNNNTTPDNSGSGSGAPPTPSTPSSDNSGNSSSSGDNNSTQCIAVNQKCTDSQSNFLGTCCDKLICAGSVCTQANPIGGSGNGTSPGSSPDNTYTGGAGRVQAGVMAGAFAVAAMFL